MPGQLELQNRNFVTKSAEITVRVDQRMFYRFKCLMIIFSCYFSGPEADPAVLGDDAQEDPELCPLGARPADHGERRSGGSGLPQHRAGGRVRQDGGQGRLHPRVPPEDAAARPHIRREKTGTALHDEHSFTSINSRLIST